MKKITLVAIGLAALVCFTVTPASAQNLVISGVFDGPFSGTGNPKAIELYATGAIASLADYGLESANNGNPSSGREFTFPDVAVGAGTFIYVATESADFNTYFGFTPDYTNSVASINGDDALVLWFNNGSTDSPLDHYGVPGVNGDGEAWDYTDGWAVRNSGTGPDIPWVAGNWNNSGIDVVDGCTTNSTCTGGVFPFGTYPVELQSLSIE